MRAIGKRERPDSEIVRVWWLGICGRAWGVPNEPFVVGRRVIKFGEQIGRKLAASDKFACLRFEYN